MNTQIYDVQIFTNDGTFFFFFADQCTVCSIPDELTHSKKCSIVLSCTWLVSSCLGQMTTTPIICMLNMKPVYLVYNLDL